jgi:IS5 family transposase
VRPHLPYELPHPLYGIQLWRIGGKEIEYYVGILFNELLDHSGVVTLNVIKDEVRHSLTRMSKDGTWTKKNSRSYFGYKLHTVQGLESDMIVNYAVTTACLHDPQIDRSIPGIVTYKDKGHFSVEGRGIDAAMDKALKGYKLPIESIRRNLRITRKRSRGERPYSVMKRTFHGGHTYVTTVPRVRVKAMFLCLGHNLFNLLSLTNRRKIALAIAIS